MDVQQVAQSGPSSNGYGRRRVEREGGTRVDTKSHPTKSNINKVTNNSSMVEAKFGGHGGPSHDRLVYLATCLIGHHVEVQVKNGSVYSGIFHATNADKDFGIILKMAHMTKDGSAQTQKDNAEPCKAFSRTLIVPAKELVQIIAKDVATTKDGLSDGLHQEIMTDSYISQSHHVDLGRELKPWVPDEDDPSCPELENIFDGPWHRGWDQFQTNETLFGVKSTFNEELYTTKLERGPQMKHLEKEAIRIAREIEGETTQDLHLAEERGVHLHGNLDIDEETRFSSVYRGKVTDDSGYEEEEEEEIVINSRNGDTFGSSGSLINGPSSGISNDEAQLALSSPFLEELQTSPPSPTAGSSPRATYDRANQLSSAVPSKVSPASRGENRMQANLGAEPNEVFTHAEDNPIKQLTAEASQRLYPDVGSRSSMKGERDVSGKEGLSSDGSSATYPALSNLPSKVKEDSSSSANPPEVLVSSKGHRGTQSATLVNVTPPVSSRRSSASASTAAALSPSSSVGSLSSEKSTLNPYAKEFKLNPNAKSFVPSQSPVRPPSPVADGSFYMPSNVPAVPHMNGMPVGMGPFLGHQPVLFNPQGPPVQSPQAYLHPNGHQYGQQMLFGHPRQVSYMSSLPPEMPYRGRDF